MNQQHRAPRSAPGAPTGSPARTPWRPLDGSPVSERGSGRRRTDHSSRVSVAGSTGGSRPRHVVEHTRRRTPEHGRKHHGDGRAQRVTATEVKGARAAVVRLLVSLVMEGVAIEDDVHGVGDPLFDARHHEEEQYAREDPGTDSVEQAGHQAGAARRHDREVEAISSEPQVPAYSSGANGRERGTPGAQPTADRGSPRRLGSHTRSVASALRPPRRPSSWRHRSMRRT
jgi:hypothetical protein